MADELLIVEDLPDEDYSADAVADDDEITPPEVPETQVSESEASLRKDVDTFQHEQPMPVEHTDAVYRSFSEAYGPSEAARLQSFWGDKAVDRQAEANALLDANPELRTAVASHENEHGISIEGVQAASEYIAKKSGFDSVEDLYAAMPELDAILQENFDGSNLSMSGAYLALAHIATKAGYKFTYRGDR